MSSALPSCRFKVNRRAVVVSASLPSDRLAPMPPNSSAICSDNRRAVPSSQRAVIMAESPGLAAGSWARPTGKTRCKFTSGSSCFSTSSTSMPLESRPRRIGGNSNFGSAPGAGITLRSKSPLLLTNSPWSPPALSGAGSS